MLPTPRIFRSALVLAAGAAAVAFAADPDPAPTVTKETAFTFYRSFTRLTKTPRHVSMQLAILCAMPSKAVIEQDQEKNGPHSQARIHLYFNPAAGEMLRPTKRPALAGFPPGSVVIKEKLANDDSAQAVGGMIKHEPGYDPQGGDWEYFYAEKNGEFTTGKLANCAACHARAKATDYIFSVWDADGPANGKTP